MTTKTRARYDRNKVIRGKLNSLKSRCQLVITKVDEALSTPLDEKPPGWSPADEIEEYINRMLESCEEIRAQGGWND